MNEKFFDLKKEKQDAIMNAAFHIFAQNGYKHASTDEIVKEAAISKGLLFHYFGTKKELYLFLYDYAVRFMTLELNAAIPKEEADFFGMYVQMETAKLKVLKNYPYLQMFIEKADKESHVDVKAVVTEKKTTLASVYRGIWQRMNTAEFYGDIDLERLKQMVQWIEAGFLKDKAYGSTKRLDTMVKDFTAYMDILKNLLYRQDEENQN